LGEIFSNLSISPSAIAQEIARDTIVVIEEEAVAQGENITTATKAANTTTTDIPR
jgi:DNA-binding XRE family transcriptional regulator